MTAACSALYQTECRNWVYFLLKKKGKNNVALGEEERWWTDDRQAWIMMLWKKVQEGFYGITPGRCALCRFGCKGLSTLPSGALPSQHIRPRHGRGATPFIRAQHLHMLGLYYDLMSAVACLDGSLAFDRRPLLRLFLLFEFFIILFTNFLPILLFIPCSIAGEAVLYRCCDHIALQPARSHICAV